MLVCICNGISDKDIDNEIFDGATSFEEISTTLGIASCCGQCGDYAKALVNSKISQLQISHASSLANEVKC